MGDITGFHRIGSMFCIIPTIWNKLDETKSIIDDKQSTIKKNPRDNFHNLDYSNILNKDISGRHSPIEQRKDIDTSLYHDLLQDLPSTPLDVQ